MIDSSFPFSFGSIRLLHSERSATAPPILLGTRSFERQNSIHLFANSDVVKQQLEIEIAASRCTDDRVHPTSLELRAAVASITFFECVADQHDGRYGTTKVIEHDNWHRIFWVFVQLFERGDGFLAQWEDRFSYMRELWAKEPRYYLKDLRVESLPEDSGKSFQAPDGSTLLQYTNKI